MFAGDIECACPGVVGDSVEDGPGVGRAIAGQRKSQRVQLAGDLAGPLVDPHDAVFHVDVGVDVVPHTLEFVQVARREAVAGDPDLSEDGERRRVAALQRAGSVGEEQRLAVVAESPPLAFVLEGVHGREGVDVVHEGKTDFPGELDDPVAHHGDAFPEMLIREDVAATDLAGGDVDLPQLRLAVLAGALQERAVVDDQALRVGAGLVRQGPQHLVAEFGNSRCLTAQEREHQRRLPRPVDP